jgi:hypothetical protein
MTALAGGDQVDTGMVYESKLAKLDWRPSVSQSLSATYIESPNDVAAPCLNCADRYTVVLGAWAADMLGVGWNWAISDSLFFDAHIAEQTTVSDRSAYAPEGDQVPGADPWSPYGNDYCYQDLQSRLFWSGPERVQGLGPVSFPRDQINAALEWFTGNHDIKFGVDYQEVAWESGAVIVDRVRGRGYNPNLPGGFVQPSDYREYYKLEEGQVSRNESESIALFVRDRMTANRWTINLGLRVDQQEHWNDVGTTTIDTSDVSPRATVVYDAKGDSTVLLSATGGRYVTAIPQNWSAQFNETPSATRFYDQYGWNPATQAYDRFIRSVLPGEQDPDQVDAYHKDEFTLGADWAFHPIWALKAKAVYWTIDDVTQSYNQLDDGGAVVVVQENNPWAEMEHKGLSLSLVRRFRGGWSFGASYNWAETTGTCNLPRQGAECQLDLGAMIDFVDPETGVPWSLLNRDGTLDTDRTHVVKLRGMYRLPLGRGHTLNISGMLFHQSGEVWTARQQVPVAPGQNVWVYQEPLGSNRLDDQKQLNTTLEWRFPIAGGVTGALRWEVWNVTNEQELIGKAGTLETRGFPAPDSRNYQRPLTQTILASITF